MLKIFKQRFLYLIMGKSIGVVSLKGGVGKTSLVSALGSALANFDKKVLLVDGNFSAPNLGIHFNLIEPKNHLHGVLNREIHAKEAIHNLGNLDILPASMFLKEEVNPLKLKDRMNYLKSKYDYILYDSSPSLNDETLGVMLASDSLIVVTTPDTPTLATTLKAINLAKERGVNIDGLIINKVHGKDFEIPLEKVEDFLDAPVLGVIPYDVNILKALSKFTSSVNYKPKSEATKEYMRLASVLAGKKYKTKGLKRFFKWINPKKQDVNRLVFYESIFK